MAQVRERGIYNFATPRNGRIALPWHFRNEVGHYGYLDVRPCYDNRPFRIYRWLYPDGGACDIFEDFEPVRYSEQDEFAPESWEMRMYPWEDEDKGCTGIRFFGYSRESAIDYVDSRLYMAYESGKFDRVGAAFKPFGGEPMICGVKDGKVTLL